MPWDVIALLGVLALWAFAGLLPGAFALIATRGRAGPLAMDIPSFAGLCGGALVPALGGKDATAFALSMVAAFGAGVLACAALVYRTRRERAAA